MLVVFGPFVRGFLYRGLLYKVPVYLIQDRCFTHAESEKPNAGTNTIYCFYRIEILGTVPYDLYKNR